MVDVSFLRPDFNLLGGFSYLNLVVVANVGGPLHPLDNQRPIPSFDFGRL